MSSKNGGKNKNINPQSLRQNYRQSSTSVGISGNQQWAHTSTNEFMNESMDTPRDFDYHRIISIDEQNIEDCCRQFFDFDTNYYNIDEDPLGSYQDKANFNNKDQSSSQRKKLSTDQDSYGVDGMQDMDFKSCNDDDQNEEDVQFDFQVNSNNIDINAHQLNSKKQEMTSKSQNSWSNSSSSQNLKLKLKSGTLSNDLQLQKHFSNCAKHPHNHKFSNFSSDVSPFQFNNHEVNSDLRNHQVQLEEKRQERIQGIFKDQDYYLTRSEVIKKVSQIFMIIMKRFSSEVQQTLDNGQQPQISVSSLLFNQDLYISDFTLKSKRTQKMNPLNDVNLDQTIKDLKNLSSLPHEESVERLYERLIKESGVQILSFNWKPIVFGSLVLAAKFWEDILYWNIDFVDPLAMYSLNSINQLEATFLGLCQYKLYVSKELYDRYYETIIRKTSEIALLEYESIEQFDANDQNIQIMQ
eukprot:403336098